MSDTTDDAQRTATDHAPTSTDERSHGPGGHLHDTEAAVDAHGTVDHDAAGDHDAHAHTDEALGPVDVQAWGALLLGAGLGLIVALCVAVSISA